MKVLVVFDYPKLEYADSEAARIVSDIRENTKRWQEEESADGCWVEDALRPEVLEFAKIMERKLRENNEKGGWKTCSTWWLLGRAHEELVELRNALDSWMAKRDFCSGDRIRRLAADVIEEAADVANFVMMIADVVKERS